MKKLLYLFILSTILISCSSNDDESLDPIIGTWQLQSVLEDGIELTTECERKTTLTFNENGTTASVSFFEDGNGCESETETSTWENTGDSMYNADGEDNVLLTFSQNNTVFSASTSETFNGMTYTFVITYKKI